MDSGLAAGNVNVNQAVTLRFTYVSGAPSYMALDNLTFDQVVVPEPGVASLGLLGAGLGAMAMRRRKQL